LEENINLSTYPQFFHIFLHRKIGVIHSFSKPVFPLCYLTKLRVGKGLSTIPQHLTNTTTIIILNIYNHQGEDAEKRAVKER
jgi:hypothetical protein